MRSGERTASEENDEWRFMSEGLDVDTKRTRCENHDLDCCFKNMSSSRRRLKLGISTVFLALGMITLALAQGIPTRGPTPPAEFKKALDQFNADIAAWNGRCKITRSEAEEAWCKKERARIDARRTELVALGAIPKG